MESSPLLTHLGPVLSNITQGKRRILLILNIKKFLLFHILQRLSTDFNTAGYLFILHVFVVSPLPCGLFSIGKSLFTTSASFALTRHSRIELQKYHLWMLKEYGTINCPNKFEPEVLHTFVCDGFKISLALLCHQEMLKCLKGNISFNITCKERIISQISECLVSIRV